MTMYDWKDTLERLWLSWAYIGIVGFGLSIIASLFYQSLIFKLIALACVIPPPIGLCIYLIYILLASIWDW